MLSFWHLAAIALWVTASSASFYDKYVGRYPDKTIPYCFESTVTTHKQGVFNKAVAIWTNSGIDVKFVNKGDCPKQATNTELGKMLLVSAWYEDYHASSYGHTYSTTSEFQYLKMSLTKSSSKLTHRDLEGELVHELGHVLGLLNENQRHDLKSELTWTCQYLLEYIDSKSATEKAHILKACGDIDFAYQIRYYGPMIYAPFPAEDKYRLSTDVDYDSVMFINGKEQAKTGVLGKNRIIKKKSGATITGRSWRKGPTNTDVDAVNTIYEEAPQLPPRPSGADADENVVNNAPVPPYTELPSSGESSIELDDEGNRVEYDEGYECAL